MAALALMAGLMYTTQLALSFIPNVHLTAVLIVLTSIFFGWKAMCAVLIYVVLEGLTYGFGVWWISYLYAWPLLCTAAVLLRKNTSPALWAVTAGAHGLLFGALCALLDLRHTLRSYSLRVQFCTDPGADKAAEQGYGQVFHSAGTHRYKKMKTPGRKSGSFSLSFVSLVEHGHGAGPQVGAGDVFIPLQIYLADGRVGAYPVHDVLGVLQGVAVGDGHGLV